MTAGLVSGLLAPGLGLRAGRMQPVGWTPTDGDYALVLGSDDAGNYAHLAAGDVAGFEQTVDLTSVTILEFSIAMRQTSGARAGEVHSTPGFYPTNYSGGETLQFAIDGGSTQTITFQDGDESIEQVVARINATISGGVARGSERTIWITSSTTGASSSVQIIGGTGLTEIGFAAGSPETGEAVTFKASVLIDGTAEMSWQPDVGSDIDYTTRKINVSGLTGNHEIRLQLEAVAA